MRPLACRAHRDKPYAGSVGVFYGQNHPYFDQKSPGTPGNVVELLARNEKSVVFVNGPKVSKTIGIMVLLPRTAVDHIRTPWAKGPQEDQALGPNQRAKPSADCDIRLTA